jgi:diguanylate cyclase (GGDEF)-like protein/PAS domain S-box-containing protein
MVASGLYAYTERTTLEVAFQEVLLPSLAGLLFILLMALLLSRYQRQLRLALVQAQNAEAETRSILEQSPDPLISINSSGHIIKVNKSAVDFFGYGEPQLLSMKVEDLIPNQHKARHVYHRTQYANEPRQRVMAGGKPQQALLADGRVRAVAINLNYFTRADGEVLFSASLRDVTEENRIKDELLNSEKRLRFLMDKSPVAACIKTFANGQVVYVNPAYANMVNLRDQELSQLDMGAYYADCSAFRDISAQVRDGTAVSDQLMEMDIPGRGKRWVQSSYLPMQYQGLGAMLCWYADITELKQHQDELEYLAQYDSLTGLPNRLLFHDRLQLAMHQTRRRDKKLALVFIDLDGFKQINDSHGHDAGDELLTRLAKRMKETLRDSDTIARLGGDEFVMLLGDLHTLDDCLPLVKRVMQVASRPVSYQGRDLQVTASLGITLFPQQRNVDEEELLLQADQAMYRAKQLGKNRYQVYHETSNVTPIDQSRA